MKQENSSTHFNHANNSVHIIGSLDHILTCSLAHCSDITRTCSIIILGTH